MGTRDRSRGAYERKVGKQAVKGAVGGTDPASPPVVRQGYAGAKRRSGGLPGLPG